MPTHDLQTPDTDHAPKSPLALRFNYKPLLADAGVRWAALYLLNAEIISGWQFWLIQLIGAPIAAERLTNDPEKLKKVYPDRELTVATTLGTSFFAWIIVLTGAAAVYTMTEGMPRAARFWLPVLSFFLYGFWVVGVYIASYGTTPPQRKPAFFPKSGLEATAPSDRNDIVIVEMETEVQSIAQRVEAYTLESTLLGALAFSGFLSLMSAERDIVAAFQSLRADIMSAAIVTSIGGSPSTTLEQNLSIVAVETLLCSMFFLGVVLSRLRFYSMLRQVQYGVQVARAWNTKEEAALNLRLERDTAEARAKLVEYSNLVSHAIEHAAPLFDDLRGITRYISVFRNLGVLSFLVVLLTSAYIFSVRLGIFFFAIGLFAFLYSSVDHWVRHRKLRDAPFFRRLTHRRSWSKETREVQ